MLRSLHGAALFCVLVASTTANAATLNFTAPLGLTGGQEVPVKVTSATGTGTASYDTGTLLLDVKLIWTGLSAAATAAHIHCCSGPGVNSIVAVDFVPAGFPNTTSGMFAHSFDLGNAASYGATFLANNGGSVDAARATLLAGLSGGLAYFNIHNTVYPGGEIRGDIAPVPLPAGLLLFGSGVLAVFGVARRRHGCAA